MKDGVCFISDWSKNWGNYTLLPRGLTLNHLTMWFKTQHITTLGFGLKWKSIFAKGLNYPQFFSQVFLCILPAHHLSLSLSLSLSLCVKLANPCSFLSRTRLEVLISLPLSTMQPIKQPFLPYHLPWTTKPLAAISPIMPVLDQEDCHHQWTMTIVVKLG